MDRIDGLISALEPRSAGNDGRPFFVAIDGHSAAGKSALSRALVAALPGTAVVSTDDFYRVMSPEARFRLDAEGGYRGYYDWQRMRRDALEPLWQGRPARFQIYDWANNALGDWREIAAAPTVIVEGCYSARPEYEPIIGFVALVEADAAVRRERQAARADASAAWLARWDAAERYYFAATGLRGRADIIVRGQ